MGLTLAVSGLSEDLRSGSKEAPGFGLRWGPVPRSGPRRREAPFESHSGKHTKSPELLRRLGRDPGIRVPRCRSLARRGVHGIKFGGRFQLVFFYAAARTEPVPAGMDRPAQASRPETADGTTGHFELLYGVRGASRAYGGPPFRERTVGYTLAERHDRGWEDGSENTRLRSERAQACSGRLPRISGTNAAQAARRGAQASRKEPVTIQHDS